MLTLRPTQSSSRHQFDDSYRTIPEHKVANMLALAGWAYQLDDPAVVPLAHAALMRWVDAGLPCRTSGAGQPMFDPVEVWTFMKRLGRNKSDPYFREHYAGTGRRMVHDLAVSSASNVPFRLEISRTFDVSGAAPDRSLRLRSPLPIAECHALRSVEVLGDAADRHTITENPHRLEVRCVPSRDRMTIAARIGFSSPKDIKVEDDWSLYLRPREGAIVVSSRVNDLAHGLARQGSTVPQAVRAFWEYMIEMFLCAPIHYDQIDPLAPGDWVMDAGVYDCRLGAALFVALCRARSIPARMIGGYVLYRQAPTNHFWAEYWCPDGGWTPVDFLGWDLSCGGEDANWRVRFFGQIDARLVTERLPLAFTGPVGVPVPRQWHLLQTACAGGVEIALTHLDGRPVYIDVVRMID